MNGERGRSKDGARPEGADLHAESVLVIARP